MHSNSHLKVVDIDFTVDKMIDDVEIRISDNGIGIPKERIDKIFDRFLPGRWQPYKRR